MKRYLASGSLILLLFVSYTSSAQYGRHNRGYSSRYYRYDRFPARTSVSIIARLPVGAVSLTFGDRYYHYYNGVYYRPYIWGYRMVEPPVGIIVPVLPPGCTHIVIGANPYYRSGNIYYAPYGDRYRVVDEPKEPETSATTTEKNDKTDKTEKASVTEYEKIILEGKTYYKKGDKYYKASVNKTGEVIYEEVGETTRSN